MERTTITAAAAQFGISTRTLRYCEQIGLIESQRREDYACRTYAPETVQRIGQILSLRRLRIPLSEVAAVLADPTVRTLLAVLQTNIARIDAGTDALSAIRSREPFSMGGCLEEHLNAPGYYASGCRKGYSQIDLMIPIEEK